MKPHNRKPDTIFNGRFAAWIVSVSIPAIGLGGVILAAWIVNGHH